jgi:hypothetical protein
MSAAAAQAAKHLPSEPSVTYSPPIGDFQKG